MLLSRSRADVTPGESLTCQVIVALAGTCLVSRLLSWVLGHWSLLHPCPLPVLASQTHCHSSVSPAAYSLSPCLCSQAGIAVWGDDLVWAQGNGREVHSFLGTELCCAVIAEAPSVEGII